MGQISGGYLYNRYLVEHLCGVGFEVHYHPDAVGLEAVTANDVLVADGIVLPELADRLLAVPASLVLLLHVVPDPCLMRPAGERTIAALYRRSRIVVTGNSTLTALCAHLASTGVDTVKIEPGVPEYWRTKARYSESARLLLGVANYLPGKGIERLIEALAPLRHLAWRLTVRGNTHFDPRFYQSMLRLVAERELADRIELLGPVPHEAVNDEMVGADLLVHLSEHESYSMVTAEAIASGLPVLSYRTGDAETFGRSGLVHHIDPCAEQGALAALIADTTQYATLRRRGHRDLRTWQQVGSEFVDWLVS